MRATLVTPKLLARFALPIASDGDKEERGRVLVIGGSADVPGAAILAGTAALRAGAGKLQVATAPGVSVAMGIALPESLVSSMKDARALGQRVARADALVVGPGMLASPARWLATIVKRVDRAVLVLDAAAMTALASAPKLLHRLEGRAILTPHAGELATLLGVSKRRVLADPLRAARRAAERHRAIVVAKGVETFIVSPEGEAHCSRAGNAGLATSGSGDVLAGVIGGLAARGAAPIEAACWGVYLHARAGERLAERVGLLGYLARELLDEIPREMAHLCKR